MGKKILLVDDEAHLLKGLRYSLEQEGYEISIALNGEDALSVFEQGDFDLILLDLMLPKMDGKEVCQAIRKSSTVPIIMLTAKGDDMDKILGLDCGADDYITKPFNILEVKARIKAILRRVDGLLRPVSDHAMRFKQMVVIPEKRSVTLQGKEVRLTATEYDLLYLFMSNPGIVFSREQLLEKVWEKDNGADGRVVDIRTVDVHIRRLREKIEKNTMEPEYIFTKWGVGYYFKDGD